MSFSLLSTIVSIARMAHNDEYLVPLDDQRVFGAGIKRKRVQFVPAAPTDNLQPAPPVIHERNAGDRYLSIVLPSESRKENGAAYTLSSSNESTDATSQILPVEDVVCSVCHFPIDSLPSTSSKPHEASLVHQVCLTNSHPPSHLDRTSHGLKYLFSYGWNPDSRLGLGPKGEGIREPLKGKVKNDTVGLGVKAARKTRLVVENKVQTLDAKGLRKRDVEDRKKRERLQEMFYGNGELERYLGPNG